MNPDIVGESRGASSGTLDIPGENTMVQFLEGWLEFNETPLGLMSIVDIA